jgi:hypothetical protein
MLPQARQDMVDNYSPRILADTVKAHLERIKERLKEKRREAEKHKRLPLHL